MKSIENKTNFQLRLNLKSLLIFIVLFVIEVIIALFVNDAIIRPYGGDVLVVIMLYYLVKAFVSTRSIYLILPILAFAYLIEISQHFHLVEILGLGDFKVARIVIGSSFSWGDLLAYTIGAVFCYFVDRDK